MSARSRSKTKGVNNRSKSDVPRARKGVAVLNVSPAVDCGRFPIKRVVGETLRLHADILKPGHDKLYAMLYYRLQGTAAWSESPMIYNFDEDRWVGSIDLKEIGTYEFFVKSWTDGFATLLESIEKWHGAGEDVSPDLEEMKELLSGALSRKKSDAGSIVSAALNHLDSQDVSETIKILRDPALSAIVNGLVLKQDAGSSPLFKVIVDPLRARFSAWYEMFHRSQGSLPRKSATFADCEARLNEIQRMGFDVIYLPPIHPIGATNRRGSNGSREAGPNDPGSPWAIGSNDGGHYSVNKDLGTLDDFKHFVSAAKDRNIDIALDIAFQCSPDHPYVREHPEWFRHRKDGSIRYAENPPKKYYDIYPFDFESKNWRELWEELAHIVIFWAENGVRFFRVDNPHTKPIDFWEWLIQKVKRRYPDVILLSEAFTRPKSMNLLSKIGFSQSYTYFTWKNTKYELMGLTNEFVLSDVAEYYRGNLFTNTPDILHEFLQHGGRPVFKIRIALAATLSSVYGIYNGFELCESTAKALGSEEYADSEKYQYKVWDWDRPGNIKEYIAKINEIRKENPALHETRNLRILKSDNENILFYGKWVQDKSNIILVAVNLDPNSPHDSTVYVPSAELGIGPHWSYTVRDLITGTEFQWHGDSNYVRLDPNVEPVHIFMIVK